MFLPETDIGATKVQRIGFKKAMKKYRFFSWYFLFWPHTTISATKLAIYPLLAVAKKVLLQFINLGFYLALIFPLFISFFIKIL